MSHAARNVTDMTGAATPSPAAAVWVDDRLVDPVAPALSAFDHGLVAGDGVFDACKVVDGQPFALSRHLRRLAISASRLGLPVPDPDRVRAAVDAVTGAAPMPLGKLRITWTGGLGPLGSGRDAGASPTLVVALAPLAPPEPVADVVTAPWTRNERGALVGIKSTSYAENVRALAVAGQRHASEAVFANTAGDLCEGTGTNVFCVFAGELVTPPLTSGALAGITRALVLAWHGALERDVPLAEAQLADEVFLTSSTRDVQPVRRWDDRRLAAPGPVTRAVQATWAAHAAEADPS